MVRYHANKEHIFDRKFYKGGAAATCNGFVFVCLRQTDGFS